MRCPRCRARNADDADWCSQCYASLASASEPADPAAAGWLDQVPAGDTAERASPPAPVEPPPEGDRPFRTTEDGDVEWRCPVCGSWGLLAVPACGVCGHRLDVGTPPLLPGDVSPERVRLFARWFLVLVALAVVVLVIGLVVMAQVAR